MGYSMGAASALLCCGAGLGGAAECVKCLVLDSTFTDIRDVAKAVRAAQRDL